MKVKIAELDIIYLSYDEPNAEENYADLLQKFRQSVYTVLKDQTPHTRSVLEYLTQIDLLQLTATTLSNKNLLIQVLDFDEHTDLENSVISWCGLNTINGLMYGNGGLKCWTKEFVLEMKTHEAAETDKAQVDFCWELNYIPTKQLVQFCSITTNFQSLASRV